MGLSWKEKIHKELSKVNIVVMVLLVYFWMPKMLVCIMLTHYHDT